MTVTISESIASIGTPIIDQPPSALPQRAVIFQQPQPQFISVPRTPSVVINTIPSQVRKEPVQ